MQNSTEEPLWRKFLEIDDASFRKHIAQYMHEVSNVKVPTKKIAPPQKNLAIVCLNSAFRTAAHLANPRIERNNLAHSYPSFNNQAIHTVVDRALRQLSDAGWAIIGICNQGGVERGYKSMEETIAEFMEILVMAPYFSHVMFCPSMDHDRLVVLSPQSDSIPKVKQYEEAQIRRMGFDGLRKPGTGMIRAAACMVAYGDRWGTTPLCTNQPYYYLDQKLGLCDRSEDYIAMETAGIDGLSRMEFVARVATLLKV
jgi:hypothetical protein